MKQYKAMIFIAAAWYLCISIGFAAGQDQKPAVSESEMKCDFSRFNPMRISSDPKRIMQAGKPDYPEDAKQKGIEGRVVVKVLVDPDGIVKQACTLSGDKTFRRAAEKAALDSVFHPVLINDKKLQRYLEERMIFEFKLTGKQQNN